MKETKPSLEIFKLSLPEWDSKIQTTFYDTPTVNEGYKKLF